MATIFRILAWISIGITLTLIYLEAINYRGLIVFLMLGWLLIERLVTILVSLMIRRVLVLQARAMLKAVNEGSGHIHEHN